MFVRTTMNQSSYWSTNVFLTNKGSFGQQVSFFITNKCLPCKEICQSESEYGYSQIWIWIVLTTSVFLYNKHVSVLLTNLNLNLSQLSLWHHMCLSRSTPGLSNKQDFIQSKVPFLMTNKCLYYKPTCQSEMTTSWHAYR